MFKVDNKNSRIMLIPTAKLVIIIQDEMPFRNSSSKKKLFCFVFFRNFSREHLRWSLYLVNLLVGVL